MTLWNSLVDAVPNWYSLALAGLLTVLQFGITSCSAKLFMRLVEVFPGKLPTSARILGAVTVLISLVIAALMTVGFAAVVYARLQNQAADWELVFYWAVAWILTVIAAFMTLIVPGGFVFERD